MTLVRTLLAVLTLAALAPIGAAPAAAETYRPWCVIYGGGSRGGGTNCGFISREQCMMTAQGNDICMQNPFYGSQSGQGSRQGSNWGQEQGRWR